MKRRRLILIAIAIAICATCCNAKSSSSSSRSSRSRSSSSSLSKPKSRAKVSKSKRKSSSKRTSSSASSSSSGGSSSSGSSRGASGTSRAKNQRVAASKAARVDRDVGLDDFESDFDLDSLAASASVSSGFGSEDEMDNYEQNYNDYLQSDFDMEDEFDSPDSMQADNEEYEEYGQGTEKGALYDAYNLLHTLAQDFEKPFDAPAVVVVGHQSSGKSALIEALMGFQFNQVGGGTKTRRPIALRMQYNPQCTQPKCFLQGEDGVERAKTLSELQEYIESENNRLERDPVRCFESREINIRMEYKYCPNMILIDTPGLIAAPKIPRDSITSGAVSMQHRALLKSAKEAERLVVNKMKCQDYIILCVEDTMDWKHGATREIVQKADPDLSRTVIVNTKLDTKVPQFGTPSDICDFLQASVIDALSPHKLGGPFFSSVPSGRVGRPGDIKNGAFEDFLFDHDDDFVSACIENEENDRAVVTRRLKSLALRQSDGKNPLAATKVLLPRVGLSRLRGFLERRVDECYRRNVAKIVPMLQAEHESCRKRLDACETELEAISVDRLKAGADAFCDEFCKALKESIQGSIIAPPQEFGETLEQENSVAGSFLDVQGAPMAITGKVWESLVRTEVGNDIHRLYGGAQYHRAMREFNLATRCLRTPNISEDEIANAAGIGDSHDGVNFLRAACVISLEKTRMSFDPLLESLKIRMKHVMAKICPISEYMLLKKKERAANSYGYGNGAIFGNSRDVDGKFIDITHNPQFRQLVRTIYENFVQECCENTMMRCYDDLTSLTRFVTWDMHERSSGALKRALPDQSDIVAIYQVAVKAAEQGKVNSDQNKTPDESDSSSNKKRGELKPITKSAQVERDYANLLQLMEEAACSRAAGRTNMVVGGLVQHIVAGWRETFARSVTTKFNCWFLLPFVDDFHKYLRKELQKIYDGDFESLGDVFDLSSARKSLEQQRQDLLAECRANKQLQERFETVSKLMKEQEASESLFAPGGDHRR
mmetsp:Transcript_99/g.131  ORF Transcript_99/g.131 Transcript_99/m.131 type:complete len:1001 (+) Transcript_99:67-3069(+)